MPRAASRRSALREATWLASHRGRAYTEFGAEWVMMPFNVAQSESRDARRGRIRARARRAAEARQWQDSSSRRGRTRRRAVRRATTRRRNRSKRATSPGPRWSRAASTIDRATRYRRRSAAPHALSRCRRSRPALARRKAPRVEVRRSSRAARRARAARPRASRRSGARNPGLVAELLQQREPLLLRENGVCHG